ncbi:MAG: hypothetical protein ACKOXT_06125 [Actinomycetota bacterium]
MKNDFELWDEQTAIDFRSYLTRAKKMDQAGAVKLRAFGKLLTAYVAPLYNSGILDEGPTVLGLRTMELSEDAEINSVVSIASVLDRLALSLSKTGDDRFRFDLPSTERVPWAGISPPRTGWESAGTIPEPQLTQIAKKGIAEVAETIPESVGGPIAARIRAEVWGRAIDPTNLVPAGAAFAAAGLGFLTKDEEVEVYRSQGWIRLSSHFGHVLSKEARHF